MNLDWGVLVQLSYPGSRHLISRFADVGRGQKKLGGKVRETGRTRIIKGQALDTGQGDVFGNFNPESSQSHDKHVGSAHALHSLVAQNIELAAVERLVYNRGTDNGVVDLHTSGEVELGELGALENVGKGGGS